VKAFKKIIKLALWLFMALIIIYIFFLRNFLMYRGSTKTERNKYYVGDSVVTNPDNINTIAISVERPPLGIWPWIAQMGLEKGGFYTYTWLENISGCKLHNADRIHPEWQNPKKGDYEPVCAVAEGKHLPGWVITAITPGKAIVFASLSDSSWTMGFYIDSVGTHESRLITRMRYQTPRKFWEFIVDKLWLKWGHCIMQRGSLKGIKKRVEQN
jgi:hypothetical protein